jgi:serine/threonine protein kinase
MREARINARLQHPYAVSVFDVVEHEGKPCIVMELVPSVPLTEVVRELGALTPAEAARVGSQVAAALAAAHALGVVHRDVKPGNVLIGDDGAARICDFGIARAFGDTTLTMTGMITGTPAYLAPETARGEESTSASDVYSLGATLYTAVEGEPPFGAGDNAMAVLYRVVAGEVRPPERAGVLGPLLVAMMSAEPQDRPSMAEAAQQLSALADGGAGSPAAPAVAYRTLPMPVPTPTSASTSTAAPAPAPTPTTAAAAPPAATAAPSPAGTPGTSVQRPADPARTPPRQSSEPATGRRPRRGLVAAIVALVVLAGTAVALLVSNLERPTAGTDPTPAITGTSGTGSAPVSTEPSTTPSGDDTTGEPTTAELAQAVIDYYGLLPDDTDAAWGLLTASYQRQTGGRDSYEDFWNDIDTVTVTAVRATAPDSVQATITYVEKSGNRESTERRSFRLVRSDGVLKIDQSSVVS